MQRDESCWDSARNRLGDKDARPHWRFGTQMARNIAAFFGGIFIAIVSFSFAAKSHERNYDAAACAGPPLRTLEARNKAREEGFVVNAQYHCVDKTSYEKVNQARALRLAYNSSASMAGVSEREQLTLAQARKGFVTKITLHTSTSSPVPTPPASLFVRSDYRNESGRVLPAFVTPDPNDDEKHPAIIWLSGGDTNSLGKFWEPSQGFKDQSIGAFQSAGVVTMFPALRGGNADSSAKEYFFGEVDDVIAAAESLAHLRYVNPDRIYLGGFGTGGTLALLAAEMSSKFAGVFAFGPVADIDRYLVPTTSANLFAIDPQERKLRSPINWMHGIASPTYLIEGKNMPGNRDDVETLCRKAASNAQVHCVLVDGADQFSVLEKVSTVIAARLAISDSRAFAIQADEF
jgi:hypothetical protein